jgi:protein TonB
MQVVRLPKPAAVPPQPKPAASKPAAKPPQRERADRPKSDARETARSGRSEARSQPAASGVGRGRSEANTNYRGIVAAHLARYKQFPPEARDRGNQGSAVVTFALNGGGRVTSVSLSRGTGVGALDQEAVAMVRRASPFPAPPDGRAVSFTVPVSFRIQ